MDKYYLLISKFDKKENEGSGVNCATKVLLDKVIQRSFITNNLLKYLKLKTVHTRENNDVFKQVGRYNLNIFHVMQFKVKDVNQNKLVD